MRRTARERPGEGQVTLLTDDRGTMITAADGHVIEEHGTDRHEEALDRWRGEGWRVTDDGEVRPPEVASAEGGTPGVADGQGPAATVTDGESS